MKNTGRISDTLHTLKLQLEREKSLFSELNEHLAVEACVLRMAALEKHLELMHEQLESKPPFD